MKETRVYLYRRMVVAMLLIVLVVTATTLSIFNINQKEEQQCWATLHAYTKMLNNDISLLVEGDRILLRTAADLIADQDLIDSPELSSYLQKFETDLTITRIGLLLPDDTVVFSDGRNYDVSGKLSFSEEASLGEHISGKEASISPDLGPVLRNFVPVEKDGETVAMLYGAVELASFPELDNLKYYGLDAAVYIIDGETGEFLLDTWNQELGNISYFEEREMKEGYSQEQMKEDFEAFRPGYVVYVSETINRYRYFYYAPSEIEHWFVAVSVPEEVAFGEAIEMRRLLLWMAVIECVCFAAYFLWVCFDARREAEKKQRRIDAIHFLYDVEKILFVAHREEERIDAALERICRISGAKEAFFIIYGEEEAHQIYLHSDDEDSRLRTLLLENDCYQDFCQPCGGGQKPEDVMVVPVIDMDGNSIGALGIHGWKVMPDITLALENVAPSFAMLYHNIKNFNRIKEMSEKDLLTDLLNRNSFEDSLSRYPGACKNSIAVIYADANGLHELNNSQGHEAGDRMLRFVAEKIKEQFGEAHTYRIGGDEFTAFSLDTEEDVIQNRLHIIDAALTKEGYHASIGMAWEKKGSSVDLDALLKLAEKRMYEAKSQWYRQQGHDRRAR